MDAASGSSASIKLFVGIPALKKVLKQILVLRFEQLLHYHNPLAIRRPYVLEVRHAQGEYERKYKQLQQSA